MTRLLYIKKNRLFFIYADLLLAVVERIPQQFFFCHPAESSSGSDETGRGGVVFIRQIFSLSHILGTGDRVGIAHSPVSALNYAHPRVSETTQAED